MLTNGCRAFEQTCRRTLLTKIAKGVEESVQWITTLEPAFAFLLALPFMVALAGLLSEHVRQRRLKGAASTVQEGS